MTIRHHHTTTLLRRCLVPLSIVMTLVGCGMPMAYAPLMATAPMESGIRTQSVPGRFVVQFKGAQASERFRSRTKARLYKNLAEIGVEVIEMPAATDIQSVQAAEEVEFAEPDYLYSFNPTAAETLADKSEKADPGLAAQYALRIVNAAGAWRITRGNNKITVAVVDTGIDKNHPDLKGKLDAGYNVLEPKSAPVDENGHGTHVAGIIAASQGNGQGVAGIAPACRVMPVKVANAKGMASTSQIAEGIAYAALHGADVINLSIGGPTPSKTLERAVSAALKKGATLVAAMGNDGSSRPMYPASYPGVIAVGATNSRDTVTRYSQKGKWISVVAPGDGILSTTPTYMTNLIQTGQTTGKYGKLSGTSMASPLVAGIVALMKSVNPSLKTADIKERLEESADGKGGFSPSSGYGRVNAAKALATL
jgi:subtilisin family serine protease